MNTHAGPAHERPQEPVERVPGYEVLPEYDSDPEPWPDELEPPPPDPAAGPPDEGGSITTLEPLVCGLCGDLIQAREVAWVDLDGEPAHPACWVHELTLMADPMRYYGMSSKDFFVDYPHYAKYGIPEVSRSLATSPARYAASCRCGWQGPDRVSHQVADDDGTAHTTAHNSLDQEDQ